VTGRLDGRLSLFDSKVLSGTFQIELSSQTAIPPLYIVHACLEPLQTSVQHAFGSPRINLYAREVKDRAFNKVISRAIQQGKVVRYKDLRRALFCTFDIDTSQPDQNHNAVFQLVRFCKDDEPKQPRLLRIVYIARSGLDDPSWELATIAMLTSNPLSTLVVLEQSAKAPFLRSSQKHLRTANITKLLQGKRRFFSSLPAAIEHACGNL
jgi:hypothetical protein